MSLSAKRPLDDTLTSSPSNSSIAASEKTHLFDLHALRYHHPFPHNIQCIETVWISVPSVNAGDCLLFLIVITIILCVYLPERGCICLCMCLCVCVRRLEADVSQLSLRRWHRLKHCFSREERVLMLCVLCAQRVCVTMRVCYVLRVCEYVCVHASESIVSILEIQVCM